MINPCDEVLDGEARYRIVKADGTPLESLADLANCKIELATNVVQAGTTENREMLLDMMDFRSKNIAINNNTITETDGIVTKNTTFNANGSITEVLSGGCNRVHTKVTQFVGNNIVETLSESIVD